MLMYNLIEYSDNYLKKIGIYGNITKMSQMITQQILSHLNLKKKQQDILLLMVIQKMLKELYH